MTEEEYRQEWLNGKHHNDYNDCRFAENKMEYAKGWIKSKKPSIDFDNPRTLADWVAHEKIYSTDTELKSQWSDKLKVREIISDMGYKDLLKPAPIAIVDFNEDKSIFAKNFIEAIDNTRRTTTNFWIKTNHGSGWNFHYNSNMRGDLTYLVDLFYNWCSLNYAYICGYEKQYEHIQPKVFFENHLNDNILDWNFWCLDGQIQCVGLVQKFSKVIENYIAFVNPEGNKNEFYIGVKPPQLDLSNSQKLILEKMKPFVLEVARKFKFVRVDMNYKNGQVYFEEATFTPAGGKIEITYL